MSLEQRASTPSVVELPAMTVIGVSFDANLKQIAEEELGKKAYEDLTARQASIAGKADGHVRLVQTYPMKPGFNPNVDPFNQLIGYVVEREDTPVPERMTKRTLPAGEYVRMTHRGRESELGRTYDELYGRWMREHGRRPAGHDFEIWDERYRPDQEDNEIDVYVALAANS
ncbi:GyrI-like domain-containing protein [Paenibacillus chartarius]|uniref:GyrI-like domain-containing protein n=1 Tax=Paenibacillus chartarius TaxID=747481 RepID=A0ABV6DF75_9BACL